MNFPFIYLSFYNAVKRYAGLWVTEQMAEGWFSFAAFIHFLLGEPLEL